MNLNLAGKNKSIALIVALCVQLSVLGLTVLVVVLVPREEEEPAFVAQKTIYLPQKELEHQAALSEFQQVASAPAALDVLSVEALLPDALPALPVLPSETFSELDPPNPLADAESFLSNSGILGQLQGLNAASSSISFLGIEDQASRVVIAFDVSTSVVNNMKKAGLSLTKIKRETAQLIDTLCPRLPTAKPLSRASNREQQASNSSLAGAALRCD